MLFNSLNFAIFLPIIYCLYWFVTNKSLKAQNILLLVSSYFFYACWDWKFMILLIFSTFLDYYTGLRMCDGPKYKKFWFWLSIFINIGFLGIFKYYNFFASSFSDLISNFGLNVSPITLSIILPIGISFYTFHGLSYVIDIYNNKIRPEKNFIDYSVFVCFFPLLVAGPIERATHLLPQIKKVRVFSYNKTVDGLRQILWGFFKKVVIADQCAEIANPIFNDYTNFSGVTLVIGAVLFAFQIYGDFSGYSDIALGVAKLFGIDLLKNFAFPYFSRDIAEFWRRWHISLSTWFRDYLYIPLGGSKGGSWSKIKNTFIIFLVSGFWHGANWTFIVWGLLNAIYIMPSIIFKTNRNNLDVVANGKFFPSIKEFFSILLTFTLTVFAWIFFRSRNVFEAVDFIKLIFVKSFLNFNNIPSSSILGISTVKIVFFLLIIFVLIEWLGRHKEFALQNLEINLSRKFRYLVYYGLVFLILFFSGSDQQFIYFQF
jgi:alginate O-acetyltransferase complex protein AlgI